MRALGRRGAGPGYTLVELMIVLLIIGVLMAISVPAYRHQVLKTQRSLGRGELLAVLARQEQFFVNHKAYATSLVDLGFDASPYAIDREGNRVAEADSDRIYLIALDITAAPYTLSATPQLQQAKDSRCGTLRITLTGLKSASGAGGVAECW